MLIRRLADETPVSFDRGSYHSTGREYWDSVVGVWRDEYEDDLSVDFPTNADEYTVVRYALVLIKNEGEIEFIRTYNTKWDALYELDMYQSYLKLYNDCCEFAFYAIEEYVMDKMGKTTIINLYPSIINFYYS